MSKNLTRKGIAFGAAFALGSTLLAGAPAFAAAELNLEPNAGTEYTMIEGETFTLKAFGNSEFLASNGTQLRVKIENVGGASFGGFAINGVTLDDNYGATTTTSTTVSGATNTTIGSNSVGNSILYSGAATGSVAGIATTDAATAVLGLGASVSALGSTSVSAMTAPFTVSFNNLSVATGVSEKLKVTVWADANNDGVLQAGEITSPARTVTYLDAADVKPAIVSQPWAGVATLSASLTLGDVNEAQIPAANIGLKTLNSNASPATPLAAVTGGVFLSSTTPALLLNSAKTAFEYTVTPTVAPAVTGDSRAFTMTAVYDVSGTTPVQLGANAYVKTVSTASVRASAANTKLNVIAGSNAAIVSDNSTASVRLNSEYVARLVVKDGAATPVAVSSIATTATFAVVSPLTLSATKYVTINGTSYTSNATLAAAELTGTSDSNGYASATLNTVGFVAEDAITVSFVAEGSSDTIKVTSKSAAYSLRHAIGSEADNDGYDASVVIGGTFTTSYVVADQFGFAPANGSYNVTLARAKTTDTASRTTAATWALVAAVVDGKATFTVTDNGTGAGTDTLTATLVGGTVAGSAQASEVVYTTTAAAIPTVLTFDDNQVAASSNVAINATALPAWNYYATKGVAEGVAANNIHLTSATTAADADLALNGVVTNASNIGIEGVPVTIAATGITFVYTDGFSKKIYSRDSIVVPTSAGGSYSVKAFSDAKGGIVAFTSTVGALSKTSNVTFAQGSAKGLAITAPANSASGRIVDVTVKVTDASGQAVSGIAVTLKSTGAGYLNSQSATTDASGEVISKLIVGASEAGTATISVTATIDGVVTTKSTTVTIGSAAVLTMSASVAGIEGRVATTVRNAIGKAVTVTVNGRVLTPRAPKVASERYLFHARAGKTTVVVKVDGVTVVTRTVMVR